MKSENSKYQELEAETRRLQEKWLTQIRDMEVSESSALEELVDHYQWQLQQRQDEICALQGQMEHQQREFESNTEAIDQDADTEVLGLCHEYEQKLYHEKENVQQIKQENQVMKRKFDRLNKDIADNKAGLNKMFLEEKKLHNIIKSLEKDIVGVRREMQERDETIQDKEKRVYDLKKKNQELEKFKFVLDYKITELKKQVEPRDRDIIELSKTIRITANFGLRSFFCPRDFRAAGKAPETADQVVEVRERKREV
ncbi:MAG: LOW QUALITY PROTEIN: hypothetical protein BJ554DRAFT_3562 [Olpidium bornovanus]|uniref:Uncharacterized protein n=1 Tax=Olpidium bornovanus TaxID=278681 RepID=A0A8H7ZNY9_9FUNG|nr:MAG: LOW QUALITY PROTEIN: hypothetical protein BJ554DRAFT_3562 [Olpidium bornovanus]